MQIDALKKAGCSKVYTEVMSGACGDRPVLWKLPRGGGKKLGTSHNALYVNPNPGTLAGGVKQHLVRMIDTDAVTLRTYASPDRFSELAAIAPSQQIPTSFD